MTPQPPPELFVRERPIRSDFSRDRSYARRRRGTIGILGLIIAGIVYGLWHHAPTDPADIPTIKAEGVYKQKPADPGGQDIPHQDVRIYDELEGKAAPPPQAEHLLPPPEMPQPPTPPATQPRAGADAPQPQVHAPAPDILPESAKALPVATTVAPAPVPAETPQAVVAQPSAAAPPPNAAPSVEAAPKPAPMKAVPPAPPRSIEQIIKETAAASEPSAAVASSGHFAIQLASSPDSAKAATMKDEIQGKYAALLGPARLNLVRADLGDKGIYYRIQSQTLSEAEANRICSALKQKNAGCILVRK